MNFSFANLYIQLKPDGMSTNLDEVESQSSLDSTILSEEQISVVRRRFIHVKRMARNKNVPLHNSVRIEKINTTPRHSTIEENAEEAGLSTPPLPRSS